MLKHVYRVIVTLAVFFASVYFFSMGVEVLSVEHEKTVEVGGATFPVVHVKAQGLEMNRLYGYSGNLSPDMVRESITPLGAGKTFEVFVKEYDEEIRKIKYELRDAKTNELLDSGSISALENTQDGKSTKITLETELKTSTEYALKLTAVTRMSRKIHYFTRVKYYMEDSFLKEKMEFALRFHKDSFVKDGNKQKLGANTSKKGIRSYLEPENLDAYNSTLAKVDIHSSYDLVTWLELKPKVVTTVIPTVKEFNMETGCFQLTYLVEIENRLGKHRYYVTEFYRIRYASGQYYLLAFERTVESEFVEDNVSPDTGEIKLGVTSDTERKVIYNSNHSKISFVRDGGLYYYDQEKKDFTQVYSFYQDGVADERKLYREHDIQIIKMDEEGNIHFVVYGHMTRGDYEGKVAIVLYKFHVVEDSIEELAYIPLQTTYQKLKEDFERYCYVNAKDDFYFNIYNKVLSYNTIAKSLKVVASGVAEGDFFVLEGKNCFVWEDDVKEGEPNAIHMEDLDTGELVDVPAKEGEGVKLLGTMDDNVILGRYRLADVAETADGTRIVPVRKLEIVDSEGTRIKAYENEKKGYYYTNATIQSNIIVVGRVKKVKQGSAVTYQSVEDFHIASTILESLDEIRLGFKNSEDLVREWYINIPSNEEGDADVRFRKTKNYVITEDTTLHLDEMAKDRVKYYVYAYGVITDSSENPAQAIQKANEKMGVVISAKNQLVWERGGKFLRNSVSGIENTKASGKLSGVEACAYMLLKAGHVSVSVGQVSDNKGSALALLGNYLEDPVNLSGCSLDDVLYFVSGSKPVIGMLNKTDAVLITGYDDYNVSVVNPKTGLEETWGKASATRQFEDAGNVFISYLE